MERGKTQQFACFGGISPPHPEPPSYPFRSWKTSINGI